MADDLENQIADAGGCCLQTFQLYETRSNFYLIGRDKNKTFWRVLKINRLEPLELDVCEDPVTYSEQEHAQLLRRIDEGNKPTGGLRSVTPCYGIVGFFKFLGPYYMLLITKRKEIGTICGHTIYTITKTKMIPIPNSTVQSDITDSRNENRYKKLLCTVDLTKDFFFSYSYPIMCSLQKNSSASQSKQDIYETMFVWNDFLTRKIRNHLQSAIWTVPLVYGFFKQEIFSLSGRQFRLTLIARRSRHYAGTRYLKRGVNKSGSVANDVETEQIVCEDNLRECPTQVTSIVQNRGSIPLYWSQEASKLNLKPDIILEAKDKNYKATRLHFENLSERYGNPIFILNLIKTQEKKPRESKLRTEFAKSICHINKDLSAENELKFIHWDLNRRPRRKAADVLEVLGKVAANSLNETGFFHHEVAPNLKNDNVFSYTIPGIDSASVCPCKNQNNCSEDTAILSGKLPLVDNKVIGISGFTRSLKTQKGILRTNCIDCLDRTNVAQYAYGLAAFGNQLFALGFIGDPTVDLDNTLANDLMKFYEIMGDTLALQYTGSAAHNKIFSERRGYWKAAIQSQEFLRTLQRYYSNAYKDAEKQDAINVFLGYFEPQKGKANLWELDYAGRQANVIENPRPFLRRSISAGSILCESSRSDMLLHKEHRDADFSNRISPKRESMVSAESIPEISTLNDTLSHSRCIPTVADVRQFRDGFYLNRPHSYASDFSNFLDIDQLSSSCNSCDGESSERSSLMSSGTSTENNVNDRDEEIAPLLSTGESIINGIRSAGSETPGNHMEESTDFFSNWVLNGGTLWKRY
ncbi:Polyphosphoinositide phosphatase [Zostera marina]|uniref:Polyphosphoinositide phosphatase n=1 Tax=Zostera marina TaxID=29655 RepID=A0A0K9NM92_ZOSMR|nr:Polyphosphoinositide phosphatase [Zostera marina]